MIIRILLMAAIIVAFVLMMKRMTIEMEMVPAIDRGYSSGEEFYWPESKNQLIQHSTFTLAYDEENEQAQWVAYVLTREELNKKSVDRTDWFEKDEAVATGSADFYDYKGSGFSKGHLIPSADRAWNREVNEETFLMSNISPQVYNFNGGVWRELEENVRDWARSNNQLYIITGPVIGESRKTIGSNRVTIPEAFFKVILDLNEPEQKAIGFLIPNKKTEQPLTDFSLSIDEIERVTGVDFFHRLIGSEALEEQLESAYDLSLWPVDKRRYNLRKEKWNNY